MMYAAVIFCGWLLLHRGFAFRCDTGPTDDPCKCGSVMQIFVNSSEPPGSVIDYFNNTALSWSSPCSVLNLTDTGDVLLAKNLTHPTCVIGIQRCRLICENLDEKDIAVFVTHPDVTPAKFPKLNYTTTVPENATRGTVVMDFTLPENAIYDTDCGAHRFAYKLAQNGNGHFEVDGDLQDGIIRVAGELDYETTPQFVLNVTVDQYVEDGIGNSAAAYFTLVYVAVEDIDDNDPAFDLPQYVLHVLEEQTSTNWITTTPPVNCFDLDFGVDTTVMYSFSDYQNSTDTFDIDPMTGRFAVRKKLDRENDTTHPEPFDIWCYQADNIVRKSSSRVVVNVLDVNDHPAVFEPEHYTASIREHSDGYVTSVVATEDDLGANARIIYELIEGGDVFRVNNDTGAITVNNPARLDRETYDNLTVLVVAHDLEGTVSDNTATVMVILEDINDNSPYFDKDRYIIRTNLTEAGEYIGTVHANDADQPDTANSNVTFTINVDWSPKPLNFNVTESGDVTITTSLETGREYNFFVSACDNPIYPDTSRCSVANVVVLVEMTFGLSAAHQDMSVSENLPPYTNVGALLITGDSYVCSSEYFTVDTNSHTLQTLVELDREQNTTFDLEVNVELYDQVVGNISISVAVLDVNDNVPTFTQSEYVINVRPTITEGDILAELTAEDEDEELNGQITYSLENIQSSLFTINSNTGELQTGTDWSNSASRLFSVYQFLVVAEDGGVNKLRSSANVLISFLDASDSTTVGVQTPLASQVLNDYREGIERECSELVMKPDLKITDIIDHEDSKSTVKSYVYMSDMNTSGQELQRLLIQHWSQVQGVFRQYMEARIITVTRDNSLSPTEIALIAVALAIFVGTLVAVVIICKQWQIHVKQHHLYNSLKRPSTMYDSQELRKDFGEEIPSQFSTVRRVSRGKDDEIPLEGSFGYVNTGYETDGESTGRKTPIWHTEETPRIPRWNTSDSLKDAIQSLEDLTNRLNSEDNISAVTNLSRERRSLNRSEPSTPRGPESASRLITPRSDNEYSDVAFDNGNEDVADTNPYEFADIAFDNKDSTGDAVANYENLKSNPPVMYTGGKDGRTINGLNHYRSGSPRHSNNAAHEVNTDDHEESTAF